MDQVPFGRGVGLPPTPSQVDASDGQWKLSGVTIDIE